MSRLLAVVLLAGAAFLLALPAGATPTPKQRIAQLERQVAALKTKVARLEQERQQLGDFADRALGRELALRRRAAAVDPCAITRPNGSRPPGDTFGAEFHGSDSLWVGVSPSNVTVDRADASGAISAKFGWWRGAAGALRIEGRRLDSPAPPLRAAISDGYGNTGFQSTSITFPTEGCWEVTGRAGDAALTFVTLVLKA